MKIVTVAHDRRSVLTKRKLPGRFFKRYLLNNFSFLLWATMQIWHSLDNYDIGFFWPLECLALTTSMTVCRVLCSFAKYRFRSRFSLQYTSLIFASFTPSVLLSIVWLWTKAVVVGSQVSRSGLSCTPRK